MKFFIDNNLAPGLARGMTEFGEQVEHLQDTFGANTQDDVWLPYVGNNDLILITRDLRVRRNPAELAAIRKHRVGGFVLGGKGLTRCALVEQLVRNWSQLKEVSSKTKKPFLFRVPPRGKKLTRVHL